MTLEEAADAAAMADLHAAAAQMWFDAAKEHCESAAGLRDAERCAREAASALDRWADELANKPSPPRAA